MGRDDFVKVIYRGFLCPLGVRCVLVKTTERRIQDAEGYRYPVAVLRMRYQIVVREPKKSFPSLAMQFEGRSWPFQAVHFEEGFTTPSLDWPLSPDKPERFWPSVGCEDFRFPFELESFDGDRIPCRAPLLFIDASVAYGAGVDFLMSSNLALRHASDACSPLESPEDPDFWGYYNRADANRRTWLLNDGPVTYAPSRSHGDTRFETRHIVVRADEPNWSTPTEMSGCNLRGTPEENRRAALCVTLFRDNRAPVYPGLVEASIRIPPVEQLTGVTAPVLLTLHHTYIDHGFSQGQNPGEVFLRFLKGVPLTFSRQGANGGSADKAGGIASPNSTLVGLSRTIGPVGGAPNNIDRSLASISVGEFRPVDYFGSALESARLLGGVRLIDILPQVGPLAEAPKALRRLLGMELSGFRMAYGEVTAFIRRSPLLELKFFSSRIDGELAAAETLFEVLPQTLPAENDPAYVSKTLEILSRQAAIVERFRRIASAVAEGLDEPGKIAEAETITWRAAVDTALSDIRREVETARNIVLIPLESSLAYQAASSIKEGLGDLAISVVEAQNRFKVLIEDLLRRNQSTITATLEVASAAMRVTDDLRERGRRFTDAIVVSTSQAAQVRNAVLAFVLVPGNAFFLHERAVLEAHALAMFSGLPPGGGLPLRRAYDTLISAQRRIEQLPRELAGLTASATLAAFRETLKAQVVLVNALDELKNQIERFEPDLPTEPIPNFLWMAQDPDVNPRSAASQLKTAAEKWLFQFTSTPKFRSTIIDQLVAVLALPTNGLANPAATRLKARADGMASALKAAIQDLSTFTYTDIPRMLVALGVASDFLDLFTDVLCVLALDVQSQPIADAGDKLDSLARELERAVVAGRTIETRLRRLALVAPDVVRAQLTRQLEEVVVPLRTIADEEARIVEERTLEAIATALLRLRAFHDDLLTMLRPTHQEVARILDTKGQLEAQLANLLRPVDLELSYTWTPEVRDTDPLRIFRPERGERLSLISRLTIPVDPRSGTVGTPRFDLTGELRNFELHLIGNSPYIIVGFARLRFASRTNASPTCEVEVKDVKFGQCLKFIEDLRNWLKGKNGFFLDVQPRELITGFRFALPAIPLGAMILQNVRIEAAFRLRYSGDPFRVIFGLSSRRDPFELVAGVYGGTGWIQMVLGPDGIEEFSFGLAFGLIGRIEIGPIGGAGRIVAGIAIERRSGGVELTGFVETAGHVSLIGLSVSVYGYLGLRYVARTNTSEGEVRIEITIALFMFEVTFKFEIKRRFSGSGNSQLLASALAPLPRGGASIDANDEYDALELNWDEYFKAFAPRTPNVLHA
jgi:hypothetical protein